MTKNRGLLKEKFNTYYSDISVLNYRPLLAEAILKYRGQKFERILDIGCGIGHFLSSVEPFSFFSIGLEASDEAFRYLKKTNLKVIKFFLEKNVYLPFKDSAFSLVVFNQVIEHLDRETGRFIIREMIRVGESGSVLIVNSPSRYARIFSTDPHHLYCWRPNELRKEFEKYRSELLEIEMKRNVLEPWMFFRYNEKLISIWHKKNRYPKMRKIFRLFFTLIDRIQKPLFDSDIFLSVANVVAVKK